MRGANTAAGEYMGIGGAECARRTHDRLWIIADHTNFFENRVTEYEVAGLTGTWDEAYVDGE